MEPPATWPPEHNLHPSTHVMLGQLLERTTATQHDVRQMRGDVQQIKERLAKGDQTFADIKRRMDSQAPAPQISPWERITLEAVRIGQVMLVLWMTGSVDAAVRLLAGGK